MDQKLAKEKEFSEKNKAVIFMQHQFRKISANKKLKAAAEIQLFLNGSLNAEKIEELRQKIINNPSLLETRIKNKDEDECTPLLFAAEQGNLLLLEMLLNQGAGIHAIDADGDNVLTWALGFDKEDEDNKEEVEFNVTEAFKTLQEMFRLLIAKGANKDNEQFRENFNEHFSPEPDDDENDITVLQECSGISIALSHIPVRQARSRRPNNHIAPAALVSHSR